MKTGLESLDTGAPEITYSGNEGPKSPQQMQQMQQMQMAQLEEEYDAYVDDMIEQGIEPMSMQQFLEQIAAEAQMSSKEQGIGSMAGGENDRVRELLLLEETQGLSEEEKEELRQLIKTISAQMPQGVMDEGIGSMMEDPRAMAADGGIMDTEKGFKIQGGVKNYLPSKEVTVPVEAKSSKNHVKAHLAYITDKEQKLLLKKNLHGSLKGKPNRGPGGLPSLQGDFGPGGNNPGGYSSNQGGSGGTGNTADTGGIGSGEENYSPGDSNYQSTIDEIRRKAQEEEAKRQAREKDKEEKDKEEKETKETRNFFQKFVDKRKKAYLQNIEKRMYEDDNSLEDYEEEDFAKGFGGNYGKIQGAIKSAEEGTLTQSEFEKFMPGGIYSDKPGPILPAGGGGGGNGQQTQQPATPPATPPPGGGLPDIPTDFVDLSGTQSYTNPAFAGQYFYGTPTITLANGGRANYAGGGIANLRQGYFLGKLVKSITKPFKKAFRGFKKIAKSPMGKMALLALGGYYAPTLFGGTAGFGPSSTYGKFLSGKGTALKNFLSPNAIGDNVTKNVIKKAADPSGNFFTKALSSAFKPENAFSTITGLSTFSGLYTDYMNNKRKDETMADYQRRLEEERGNFAPIPTDFVQFAANGGRMGFADGGDDDDEDFRQKALGALYSMRRPQFSMGGGAGMPPVTMMSEGQDVQSFGDDESTGMVNATPTMPNQMPMRPPMMDPRMQQQMMMQQRMNPMMNRGMMSMQQPRIMAQEGGMMDMGGMEKDYRNEGGFVAIGGQERADDVPARLSKNEFVFTADAVRNAGGGDIDKGAEIMENMMENLEQGGKVSKASQGLSGAREMFATSQRLEEVL